MIYVMSDIHGHYSRYRSVMNQIRLRKTDHLYVLGDCIDRNPFGLPILREVYQVCKPMRIYHGNRMIGIDCGCAYKSGRLACLRLDDMKEFYSEQDWMPPEPEKIEELIRENSR